MSLGVSQDIVSPSTLSLSESEASVISFMSDQLAAKRHRNAIRQTYYDQKTFLKDLGISIPPQLRRIESVLGWPGKTVDVLSDRIRFERFVAPGEDDDPHGLNAIVEDNDFRTEFSQATSSALTQSCAFVTATHGDMGEPDVLWLSKSASQATGVWDRRKRGLSAGLSVLGNDSDGLPEQMAAYFPDKIVYFEAQANGRIKVEVVPNSTGRVLMVPFPVSPNLHRPFGRSRITRAVMSLTDSGIRTIVRSEVGAEFFASPQRYALGAAEEAFDGNKWSALVSRLLTVSRDEEGEVPQVGQFSQASMQPHTDQLRQWASLLASESSIPLDELGFPSDNPSSDSAIESQRDPLRSKADSIVSGFQGALKKLATTSVMLRDNTSTVPDDMGDVSAWFAPTVRVSESAAADAVLKQVQVMPWLAESPVILEKLGYSTEAIRRLLSDKRRAEGPSILDRALARGEEDAQAGPSEPASAEGADSGAEEAKAMKEKFEALGVAVRAGVDPADAAARVGLAGVKFTGGIPASIRMPERDASTMEER